MYRLLGAEGFTLPDGLDSATFQLQEDDGALNKAGCSKTFTDELSGAKTHRPGLTEALHYLRAGDTLACSSGSKTVSALGKRIRKTAPGPVRATTSNRPP